MAGMAIAVTDMSMNPIDDARTAAQRIRLRSSGAQKEAGTKVSPDARASVMIARSAFRSRYRCRGGGFQAHRTRGRAAVRQRVFLPLDRAFEMRA